MKKYLLLASMMNFATVFGFKNISNKQATEVQQFHRLKQDQNMVVNTSDPFQSSAEVYLNQKTYQTLTNNWNYFTILSTINQFPFQGQKLPDNWYQDMSKIIALTSTKVKIDQVMNPKGVIIPFQYLNISPDLILGNITSQS